ncbi:hypothetical protein [Calothrix sp. 336/3]|uniref:hypothetical protein n=1 Tax=Calothrix sp. 336/3 TaxID=1337936 RepID=UPI0004E2D269|nr:hypothetical protein [Calothrix sp. 336/3]AKG23645.1 hypothetical protein IJ00_22260 [Calothrix sp. 336/3]
MSQPGQLSQDLKIDNPQARQDAERMRDVLLLVENLTTREETNIKLIIDCLYDVGAPHLIQKKFRSTTLQKVLQITAKMSKPAFRIFAWRWLQKNLPGLITNWLHQQVKFQNITQVTTTVVEVNPTAIETREEKENIPLSTQIKVLRGSLICVTAVLGSSLLWLSYDLTLTRSQLQSLQQSQIQTVHKSMVNAHR